MLGSNSTILPKTISATSSLDRVAAAGLPTLVILADTPTFGWRPKEIRNGLSIPPKMTLRNIMQMTTCPIWSFGQLFAGIPEFKTMKPYIPKGLSMKHLGLFMNKTFSGRLTALTRSPPSATVGRASLWSKASSTPKTQKRRSSWGWTE